MSVLRTIYRYWTVIVLAAVLVQIGSAGYGAFYAADKLADKGSSLGHEGFDHGFSFHDDFGYAIFLGAVVLLLLALVSRLGRRRVLWALGLVALVALQIVLAWIGEDQPVVGIFHPVNAFLVLGLSGSLTQGAWRKVRAIG